jgi:hypothetical protein
MIMPPDTNNNALSRRVVYSFLPPAPEPTHGKDGSGARRGAMIKRSARKKCEFEKLEKKWELRDRYHSNESGKGIFRSLFPAYSFLSRIAR